MQLHLIKVTEVRLGFVYTPKGQLCRQSKWRRSGIIYLGMIANIGGAKTGERGEARRGERTVKYSFKKRC